MVPNIKGNRKIEKFAVVIATLVFLLIVNKYFKVFHTIPGIQIVEEIPTDIQQYIAYEKYKSELNQFLSNQPPTQATSSAPFATAIPVLVYHGEGDVSAGRA